MTLLFDFYAEIVANKDEYKKSCRKVKYAESNKLLNRNHSLFHRGEYH